ncbi:hypothetical protein [Streptomyces showdoensis]|uniref:Uncharacterized protein n=1 Tax=Streptomyces showdoensis TaxID=68268 RepID=A0A2P2GR03_STREW|nr:hypothetical protein [Streptomyces showdoensis]KKZ73927.1 hypothetical protein VO63_09945 [Streptomyces showdoensis]
MRFRPNRNGINSLMKSDEAGAEVRRIAERMKAAAESTTGGDFRTDSALGAHRWRAAVIGDYAKHGDSEGTRRALLRGLDGAE